MSDFWTFALLGFVVTGGPFTLAGIALDFLAELADAARQRFWPSKPEPWPEPISIDELDGLRRTVRHFSDNFVD